MTTLRLRRAGDWYEAFNADAELLARTLDLALRLSRSVPAVAVCGFPVAHAARYVARLMAAGIIVETVEVAGR